MKKQFALNPLTLTMSAAIIATSMGLTACGDNNDDTDVVVVDTDQPVDTNQPVDKELGSYSLVKAETDNEFVDYYSTALNGLQPQFEALENTVNGPVADNVEAGSSDKVSTTNLIEAGVDEVDFVKQDATHIYTSKMSYGDKENDTISIYAKPSLDPIAMIDLGQSDGLKGFFLKDENLYNFRQMRYGGNNWAADGGRYDNGLIALQTIDVASASSPKMSKEYNWQGNYIDSRRINDKVYVVSSSQLNDPWMCYDIMPSPDVELREGQPQADIMPYCGGPKELTAEDIIERMPVDINGTKVKPSDCFIPNKYNKDSNNINLNITLITEVDLTGNENHKTTCVSASAQSFYMSPNALYLASQDYSYDNGNYQDKTVLSKFAINSDGVNYAGSGAVDGHINWQAASFSMSEYDDVLRVVTSKWGDNGVVNMLHTLQESDAEYTLTPLATLPNDDQPASIGKPNEQIKGVRFLGDEGYVVTFETKDPLYKIDLSDPSNPKIAGELEMPGYSAYLHRINDKYLLGVGFTTDENSRADGVQVTVYDTSGDDPIIVDQDIIDSDNATWINLAVAEDSRAITTLVDGGVMRLSIPFTFNYYDSDKAVAYKAAEYNINLNTGALEDNIIRDNERESNAYYGQNILRSLISNDDVYYAINDRLIKYVWGAQESKSGS